MKGRKEWFREWARGRGKYNVWARGKRGRMRFDERDQRREKGEGRKQIERV